MYTNAVSLATAGQDILLGCEAPTALHRLKKAGNFFTNAVSLATAGHDVMEECEAARASGSQRLKKGDNLYTNAVVQSSAGHNVFHSPAPRGSSRRRTRRLKKDALQIKTVSLATGGHECLKECEAPRALLKLKQGDNLYTNAVSLATAGHVVLRECEASRLTAGSGSLEKVESLYTNAVVQAAGGHDVFREPGVYLVHADELVSLQRNGIGGDEDDLRVLEDRGRVPWFLAKGTQPSCSTDIFSQFDLVLLSSDDIAKLVAGAQPGTQDVNAQTGGSPEVLTSSANQPSPLLAAKGAAQSGVTGPQTPEIVQDRGRSPSADSVPSPDQQDHANFAHGELLRIVESCSPDGTTGTNPVPNEQLMITKEQGTVAPASQCAKSRPQMQVAQEDQLKAPRKRRYMPKILSEKPKGSRAKKPRRGKAANGEASPPALILETSSPTLLQMKMSARHKKPPVKRRRYVKRQKRSDEATTKLSKESPAAHITGPNEDRENAPRIQESAQLNTDGRHFGSSQCTDPLLQGLNLSMVEKRCTQGKGREHLNVGPVDDCNAPEFSKFLQESLFSDPLTKNCETFSSQIPLADQDSSSSVPLPKPHHGSSFDSEVLVAACLQIPGNVMISDELRNALDPVSSWPNGPSDLSPVDRDCAPEGEELLAVDLGHPSRPRGPVPSGNSCQDFTLVLPPPSPPSPEGAADRNGGFSRVSAASTRRTLKFDAQEDELQLAESELVLPKHAKARNEQAGSVKAMAGDIPEEESPQTAARITGLEILVAEENCVPALSLNEPMPLAVDSSERREEELQIVAYDDGSKKMVVYKKPPMRKRRVRFKPKVDLDVSTVKKFKSLMLKGSDEDDTEQDKASWEQSRRQWQNRAHQFISIMRQVQGSRAFSRWKGSVVDSVGGAFLTQNVSDFLSSNAFMALRARFPARRGAAKEHTGTSIPETKDQLPIEKETSIPQPERLTIVELKKLRLGEDRRQEEASEMVAALLSKNVNYHKCVDEELTEIVETLRTRLMECHIERRDHEQIDAVAVRGNEVLVRRSTWSLWQKSRELRDSLDTQRFLQPRLETECTPNEKFAMEGASASEDHDLVSESLPSNDGVMNQPNSNLSSKCLEVSVFEDRACSREEVCIASSLVNQNEFQVVENREGMLNPSGSLWKGKLAVIQEKFSNVVEESVSSLTVVGKEKVLAATLRLVLGKKQTTREGDKAKARALKTVKLRPERALMRRRIDNYRYRQGNVSFRLLSGEARASWEAGYVMKSQKHKWEPLRASILADRSYTRDPLTEDCVDWEAVQRASVHEVADVIKNRGMNNALAGRLKAFLDRVHRDQHGSIDLEWIRKLPPEDAKAFLLSFRGVGLKSVECIRLLTLHHPSFPVDTNVGRIAVRLGWVPLEPLPEETQLHLLDLYPIQSHIQQYMWPRLCTLDQQTLYELHYQMITFGKVFCTKSKPNCNACPLRSECKHYASSYASAKLLLKWPEKQDKQSTVFALPEPDPAAQTEPTAHSTIINEDPCIPIIEEPRSPEPYTDSSIPNSSVSDIDIPDIEEVPFYVDHSTRGDPAETQIEPPSGFSFIIRELRSLLDIEQTSLYVSSDLESDEFASPPTSSTDQLQPQVVEYEEEAMELDISESTEVFLEDTRVIIEEAMDLNVDTVVMAVEKIHEVIIEEVMEVVADDFKHLPSQELILLPPQASLAPAPKLKNVQRLRTVHFVYELPDNHPLLFEMDQREADDPCFYLLAIWSPDEVPATMPKINDDDASNPFASCEDNDPEQTVRGTLLIPCKTAMRGWFPLNGTYFQVNEVFADYTSSIQPIDVPRTLLWSLRRRFVYFSTASVDFINVSALNETDMSQEEIQCCFQKGYVCLRAFDLTTRQPKLLAPRLHQSGAKIVKARAFRKGGGKGRPRKDTPKDKSKSITTQKSTSDAPLMETTSHSCDSNDSNRSLVQPCTF